MVYSDRSPKPANAGMSSPHAARQIEERFNAMVQHGLFRELPLP